MGRQARRKSKSGIYHVMERGINRQSIFEDEKDCQKYLEILDRMRREDKCKIFGYCLMDNHVHLLISEEKEDISKIMKRIGTSYAWWYNWKYERSGHVFQDRYKSECVEDDKYLLTVIRYIHNNPVKAKIVEKAEDYRWSSCNAYYNNREYPDGLTETNTVLDSFSGTREIRIEMFKSFMELDNDDKCLEYNIRKRVSDKEVKEEIKNILGGQQIHLLQHMEKDQRDEKLRKIKSIEGASLRQIARVSGLGTNIIFKA